MAEQISIEAVMAQYADTSLAFADGEMVRCNSTALSLCSSVLRTAIEVANERGVHAQGGFKFCIPMEGVTKAEWLEVAPLWYPGMPSWPEMASTEQLELVIKVGADSTANRHLHHSDVQGTVRAFAGSLKLHAVDCDEPFQSTQSCRTSSATSELLLWCLLLPLLPRCLPGCQPVRPASSDGQG